MRGYFIFKVTGSIETVEAHRIKEQPLAYQAKVDPMGEKIYKRSEFVAFVCGEHPIGHDVIDIALSQVIGEDKSTWDSWMPQITSMEFVGSGVAR